MHTAKRWAVRLHRRIRSIGGCVERATRPGSVFCATIATTPGPDPRGVRTGSSKRVLDTKARAWFDGCMETHIILRTIEASRVRLIDAVLRQDWATVERVERDLADLAFRLRQEQT